MKSIDSGRLHQSTLWRNVMIRTLFLVILPVLVLMLYFNNKNEENIINTVKSQNEELTSQAFDSVTGYLQQLQGQILSIDSDSMLINFLTRSYSAGSDYLYYANSISNRLTYAVDALDGVTIRIYMSNPTIPVGFGIFYKSSSLFEEPALLDFLNDSSQQDAWFLLPGNFNFAFSALYRQYDSLFYIRKMAAYNGTPIGYITGLVPITSLAQNSGLNARSIHDLEDRTLTLYYTSEQPVLQLTEAQISAGAGTYENIEYTIQELEGLGLKMIVCTPLYQRSTEAVLLPLIIAGIMFWLLISFTTHISRIIRNIQQLINQARHSLTGDLRFRLSMTNNPEMNEIVKSINTLLDRLSELMKKTIHQQEAIHQAQLLALQHQINPHFIYNTVDLIAARMELQGMYEESDALGNFAALFRYNLNVNNEGTTLTTELANVRQYLNIQRISRPNITFKTNIDPALDHMPLPRFTFQPLVENSVLHGLTNPEHPLVITLSASAVDREAVFVLEDNGVGMSAKKLDELRQMLHDPDDSEKNSIGLINIHRRLLLLKGSGLEIDSIEGKSTTVTFRFPL